MRQAGQRSVYERYAGPPMTLGNMRANGVRSLIVFRHACHRETALDVEAYPDDVPVPSFGPRPVCTSCGMVGADARANWNDPRRRPAVRVTPSRSASLKRCSAA